ncbi:MAG: hypothetical protein HC927_04730 [Deltaproteobacteria bacterium]|nr:hypothetical protein [Deltaproteobacteria bacterium]
MLALLILSSLLSLAEPASDHAAALDQLELATKEANRSTSQETIEDLKQAIATIEQFPVYLAQDSAAHEQHTLALLNLARLYLATGDTNAAARAMDQAIFATGIAPLPSDRFGPDIVALHEARSAHLDEIGRVPLEVDCNAPCQVYVDGNEIVGASAKLFVGSHQLHVTSTSAEPMTLQFDIGPEGARFEYGPPTPPAPELEAEGAADTEHESKLVWGLRRPIPKWKLAAVGISGGVFVVSLGSAIGLRAAIGSNSALRREIVTAAEESLTDASTSNDIDPNSNDDLCRLAKEPPDPTRPNEVTNAKVTTICIKADTYATAAVAMFITAGVSAAATITFGLLINTHRVDSPTARLLRRHRVGVAIAPRLEGGMMAVGTFSF